VVWHPGDTDGPRIVEGLIDHFHGTTFSGLVGGAVEVYTRSAMWGADGAPRPMPFMEPLPNGLGRPAVTAVVPLLGTRLARAMDDDPAWHRYLESMLSAAANDPGVGMFALWLDEAATAGTALAQMFGASQALDSVGTTDNTVLCRDLAHSIGGLIGDPMGGRLRVFISHTKRFSPDEGAPDAIRELVLLVRSVIGDTHLTSFFDEADLLPSVDWERELIEAAKSSGMLALRTDMYASRDWCQREMLVAKRADMPIVVLHAVNSGEERGSFLMDHVPAIPLRSNSLDAARASIESALNQLVDEALKRALWTQQRNRLAALGFDWLPANAPEPTTLISWLASSDVLPTANNRFFVLHPDPPLGNAELEVINDLLELAGIPLLVDIVTPRTFASRGGQVTP
jgi:hypothetical protein